MIWDGERRWVLASNLGAYFLSIAMIYQMSPFFQIYAQRTCGASEDIAGLIFAMLPFFSFIGALPISNVINRFGTHASLSMGLLLLATSSLAFGLSKSVNMWIFWRALQGLATAPIYTSISINLADTFTGPGEFARVNGMLEMCGNLGFIVAPLLGGSVYQLGGFVAPFALSAVLHLLFLLLTLHLSSRRSSNVEPLLATIDSDQTEPSDKNHPATLIEVCSRKVCFMAFVAALIPGVWGAVEPVLASHLHSRLGKLPSSVSGLVMSYSALPCTLIAVYVPRLMEMLTEMRVVRVGLFIMGVGVAILGVRLDTSFEIGSSAQWILQISALTLTGTGWGLSWTPVLPSMIETAADRMAADSNESIAVVTTKVSSAIAALFNAAAAIGEACGPTVGGAMVSNLGFDTTMYVLGMFMCLAAASMKTCVGTYSVAVSPPGTPRPVVQPVQIHLRSASFHSTDRDQ